MNTKDFSDTDLSGENLENVDFSNAILRNTKLIGCNLTGANFYRADLWGAELDESVLCYANFERADLYGAFMRRTDLSRANFTHAYMCGLDCTGSTAVEAVFNDAYMFGACLNNTNLKGSSMINSHLVQVSFKGAYMEDIQWADGVIISRPPVTVYGLDYPVTIVDGYMDIGCYGDKVEWFEDPSLSDRKTASFEGLKSARFWKKHKDWILGLIKAEGLNKS